MKITMRAMNDVFAGSKTVNAKAAAPKAPERTDKITISARGQKTDAQFIDALKAQITNEIKAGVGADKLNDLTVRISSGEYDINPADIAHRMLFV